MCFKNKTQFRVKVPTTTVQLIATGTEIGQLLEPCGEATVTVKVPKGEAPLYSIGIATLVCPAESTIFCIPPPKFVPVTVKSVVPPVGKLLKFMVILPDCCALLATNGASKTAPIQVKVNGGDGGDGNTSTATEQEPVAFDAEILRGVVPPAPEPSKVIGINMESCPAVKVTV